MRMLLPLLLFSGFLSAAVPAEASDLESASLEVAVRHFHAQELETAESLLLSVRERRPESAEAAFYLGRVYLAQGRSQEAVKTIEESARLDPGSASTRFWLAEALVQRIGEVPALFKLGIAKRMRVAYEKAVELEKPKQQSRKPVVMVVDDSITIRKVTSRVLENHSLEVMTAQDGVDAVEKLHDRVPDLMLLDIEMPRMDGYELLQHVRADARLRHVPIVMITSRAGQKHRKKARDAGANDYLTKPYQEPELVEKVSELLDIELTPRRQD